MLEKQVEFKTFWSDEDKEFVAVCDKYPSISVLNIDEKLALEELKKLVHELYSM